MAEFVGNETSKRRVSRIRLDYYREAGPVDRVKFACLVTALVAAVAYCGYSLLVPSRHVAFSHGPVSDAHALWDSRCDTCHTPSSPLRGDAISISAVSASANRRCQGCHVAAAHYTLEVHADGECSVCHREHQGRGADLLRVSDEACTSCHSDLEEMALPATSTLATVASFASDHPPFRSLDVGEEGDPGRLRFSHSRHMRAGLTTGPSASESQLKRYRDLEPAAQEQYLTEGRTPDDLVRLECSSCHRLQDETGNGGPTLAAPGGGVFLPVSYERNCQSCHPLRSAVPAVGDSIPHGLSDAQTGDLLRALVRDAWFESADAPIKQELARPLPGRSRLLRDETEAQTSRIASTIEAAAAELRDTCQQCHEMQGDGLAVAPTDVPTTWFASAKFNHVAHRHTACSECHPQASDDEKDHTLAELRSESDRVMIPGIANCRQCHGATTRNAGETARHDCVFCHGYHTDATGAPATTVQAEQGGRLTVDELIRGEHDVRSP